MYELGKVPVAAGPEAGDAHDQIVLFQCLVHSSCALQWRFFSQECFGRHVMMDVAEPETLGEGERG